LFRLSGGIPRIINLICDRALLGAYAQSKARVDKKILCKAASEVLGDLLPKGRPNSPFAGFRSWLRRR